MKVNPTATANAKAKSRTKAKTKAKTKTKAKSQKRKQKKAKKAIRSNRARRSPRRSLKKAFFRFLPDSIFAKVKVHGNTKWSLSVLSCMGLLWALSGESGLGDRFVMATDVIMHWFPGAYHSTSYQGFIGAIVTHNATLVSLISAHLRTHMLRLQGDDGKIAGLIPFAVDGSKVAAPWTRTNEKKLGKKGRKPKGEKCKRTETDMRPQLSLTMLWHMKLALPWAWKHGGLADPERTQFRELLGQLPKNSLIVADAGFIGYDLWQAIIEDRGRHFLIRVGANVELLKELLPECDMEHNGEIVWLWPDGKRSKGLLPLKLRLIRVVRGKQTWYLVTSLLDPEQLTEAQACQLYSRRWGIECAFRTLKQTFECSKAHSYTPEAAGAELDWALLSLWLTGLLAKQELLDAQIDTDCYSAARARRLIRRDLRYQSAGKEWLDISELKSAVKDPYNQTSSKKARHDQRKKHTPAPKAPKITIASEEQRQAAKELQEQKPKAA